jgi:aerobic carbon-monoxide dehydrogenase large subunit
VHCRKKIDSLVLRIRLSKLFGVELLSLLVGQSVHRKEDRRLITGKGLYTIDVKLQDELYISFVRSPYTHALIRSTKVKRDLDKDSFVFFDGDLNKDLPIISFWPGTPAPPFPLLARGEVLYSGQLVAAVVASSKALAEDALEFIEVEYEDLPIVLDGEESLSPQAPLVHEDLKSNLIGSWKSYSGSFDAALASADIVIEEKFSAQRVTGQAIEPRGAIASFDKSSGKLTVWLTSQCPHADRTLISECLEIPEDKIEILVLDVGGGFGINSHLYPEQLLTCILSVRLGRPVKWTENRIEHVAGAIHSGDCVQWMTLAATKDGRILGIKEKILQNAGAYLQTRHVVSTFVTAMLVPGPYRIPNFSIEVNAVFTNKGPVGTYRAFGMTQATFARERMIDILAQRIGMDPADLRLKNLIEPGEFPYVNPAGLPYDSGNYLFTFSKALELSGYREFRQKKIDKKTDCKRSGIGIGFYIEMGGVGAIHALPTKGKNYAPNESARIRLGVDGRVTVFSGVAPTGQGLETTLAQVAAESLGVPLESVDIVHGDTDSCPYSGDGTIASRSANMAGNAVFIAATRLKQAVGKAAGGALGLEPNEGVLIHGNMVVASSDKNKRISLDELLGTDTHLIGDYPFFEQVADYLPETTSGTTAYGIQIAKVEVDEETGRIDVKKLFTIHDCGRMLNPAVVEGMTQGGCAQGISASLLEEVSYGNDGALTSTTFGDYLIPTSIDMPELILGHTITPSPNNPLGVKGGGEGGIIGAPAAIANAVCDAYSSEGLSLTRMITRPDALISQLRNLRKGKLLQGSE